MNKYSFILVALYNLDSSVFKANGGKVSQLFKTKSRRFHYQVLLQEEERLLSQSVELQFFFFTVKKRDQICGFTPDYLWGVEGKFEGSHKRFLNLITLILVGFWGLGVYSIAQLYCFSYYLHAAMSVQFGV